MMNMAMETSRTCLDTILQLLEELLRKIIPLPLNLAFPVPSVLVPVIFGLTEPIYALKLDLTFIKMFFWGLSYWEELEFDPHSRFTFLSMVSQLSAAANEFVADCENLGHHFQCLNWEELCYDLNVRIAEIKPRVQEISILFLRGIFKCKPCQHNEWKSILDYGKETASFIDVVQKCLSDLRTEEIDYFKGNRVPVKEIELFLRKLGEFGIVSGSVAVKSFSELMFRHRTWVCQISCLACLDCIAGFDEREAVTMKDMVHDLLSKTLVITPGVVASCIEGRVIPQLLARYIDFLLRGLVTVIPLESDFERLQDGLIFLLSFLVHPPEEDSKNKEGVLARIYGVLIKKRQFLKADKLSSFLEMIDGVKVEVRDMYFMTPHSSNFNSPRTNAVRYLDSLLGTLKKLLEAEVDFVPLTKCLVEKVGLELSSLRPFLEGYSDLQGEVKDLWVRTLDVVYYAGYVIHLCSNKDVPAWYCILGLPNVLTEIKFIENQIEDQQICCINGSLGADHQMKSSITNSNVEGDFTGFVEDVELIMNDLLRGRKDLTIISVSGMPGQGKTTLAKRIYNDPRVQQYWFPTFVWIFVSKECTKRELLIKVASNVADKKNDDIQNKTDHDLAVLVWKSLKRRRYLIVMDDVWEVGLWHEVEESFPNDSVGSRILFTSRNHDLASQANPNSISRPLRLFSHEESWELMRKKLSHFHGSFPLELSEIGKIIAIYCKGLPLAVSLIASVLARMEPDMEAWENLARDLKSRLAREGCKDVIELSYENLPDHLKPCFLYTGTFPRGEYILARKLKLLWIAEGFIKVDNENKFFEDLADDYLSNLVSQSLVVVTEKSSMGKIKKCNVHDLLYDFCLEKAKEERFLHWVESSSVYGSPGKFNHHRLCIGKCEPMPTLTRKELPTSQVHSLLWYYDHARRDFVPDSFLEDFKVLTTLDCEGPFLKEDKTCEVVFSNIHLKHVALNLRGPLSLPLAITNLWNLQTLIVDADEVISLPVSMWSMKSLRYVVVQDWRLSSEDCDQVCNSFAACCVETLGKIRIEEYDSKIEEFLSKFTRLRKLGVHVNGGLGSAIWLSMFKSLKWLESFRMYGPGTKEHSTFSSFPEIQNLKKLAITNIQLPWCLISEVGKKLPNLEVLKLLWHGCHGRSWDLKDDESFPKLRYLKLVRLDLEKMNFGSSDEDGDDSAPFPCLEVLMVEGCWRLEEIPSGFGFIPTLNRIKVDRFCSRGAKLSAKRLLQEQRDEGNDSLQVIVEHDSDELDVEVEEEDEEVLHEHDSDDSGVEVEEEDEEEEENKSKKGVAEIYEEEYVQMSGKRKKVSSTPALLSSMGSSGVGGDKSGRRKFKAKRMVKKMGSTAPSFTSSVVNNDQMQEETMGEDNVNSSMPVAPMFSQQPMPSPPGGYAQSTNPFQFAGQQMPFVFSGQQNQAAQQNANSFQASGSLEFGSFSMGSSGVGGDKSGRRNFKSKRMVKKIKVGRFCTRRTRLSAKQVLQEQRDLGNDSLQVIVEHDSDELEVEEEEEDEEEEENKSKKGVAEIYEEEYVQMSGLVSASLSFSDQQKKDVDRFCSRGAKLSAKRLLQEQREFGNNSLQVIVEHDSDELDVEVEEEDEEEEEVLHEHERDVEVEEEDEEEEEDENKSKKGVAEIYEEEYVQMSGLVSASLSFSDQQKKEAQAANSFKELCVKLDALSHFHFTPKPVIEDASILANVPALERLSKYRNSAYCFV